MRTYQEYVPLPHVFPPSAIRQSPAGRELDAIDFVAIAIPSLRSLHRAHIKRRRLIMPLVALVQKKQSAPATAYKFWCDAIDGSAVAIRSSVPYGAPFLVAAAPPNSVFEGVSAYIVT